MNSPRARTTYQVCTGTKQYPVHDIPPNKYAVRSRKKYNVAVVSFTSRACVRAFRKCLLLLLLLLVLLLLLYHFYL